VIRLGFLDIVLPIVVVFGMEFLDGRSQGRKNFGEEVVFVKQGSGGKEGVLEGMEVSIRCFLVGDKDLGVEVELER
jgi:hypothetical protein